MRQPPSPPDWRCPPSRRRPCAARSTGQVARASTAGTGAPRYASRPPALSAATATATWTAVRHEHDAYSDHDDDDAHVDALVRRNFAFIDLCGFTSLTDEHGVGAAVAALSTFRAVVREGTPAGRASGWPSGWATAPCWWPPSPAAARRGPPHGAGARPAGAVRCRCGAAWPQAGSSCSRATTTSAGRSTWRPACATRPSPTSCS